MSPPTGLAFVTANVTQGFRTWAKLVRALRRWSAEALGGPLLPHPFALFEKRWDSISLILTRFGPPRQVSGHDFSV